MAGLEIDTEDRDGRVVAHLRGSLDLATVEAWREAAAPLVDDPHTTELTVDATELGFVDSTGIGGIIDVANRAGAADMPFRVIGVRPEVARVLDLVGLSHLHDRPTPTTS